MNEKDLIRAQIKKFLRLRYRIRERPVSKEQMDKQLFIESIGILKEINDRNDFLATEIGIDTTSFEDKFFRVIENLMRIAFNKQQIFLVQMYLNDIPEVDDDWDGTITVQVGKKEEKVNFKTPEDVWNAIQKFN
jgi:hypothetical protein